MSGISNSAIERAEERVLQEVANGIGRVSTRLNEKGTFRCVDCDNEINEARRIAAPFAKRCVDCQQLHEKFGKQ